MSEPVDTSHPAHGKRALWGFVLLIAAVAIAPLFLYPMFVMTVMCFAMFAAAFNLLFSYAGLLSFGHSAFFGIAGYLSAYLARHYMVSPEVAILGASVGATLLGVLFGSVAIRRHGIYFAMITLGLAQLAYFVALQMPFTGGEDGIQGVPRGKLFGLVDLSVETNAYLLTAVIFVASIAMIYRVVHSPFGEVLRVVRENENRAISLGYKPDQYKLIAFTISAFFAGLAGALKAILLQFATPVDLHWSMSAEPILMSILGGLGTFSGPIIGAITVVTLQNFLTGFGAWVMAIQGAVFVLCVLFMRNGIMGVSQSALNRLRGRKNPT